MGNIKFLWAGHAARMGERRNAYSILVGKPEGKRPLGRPRRRWVDNIQMYHIFLYLKICTQELKSAIYNRNRIFWIFKWPKASPPTFHVDKSTQTADHSAP
jgi:hypothetical protein